AVEQGLSMNAPITKQGLDMAKLTPQLFRMAVDQELPVDQAALIGRELGNDPAQMDALAQRIIKKRDAGGEYSTKQLANLIGLAKGSATVESAQGGLFGDSPEQESALDQTASFMEKIRQRLSADKRLFGAAAKSGNVEKLEKAGNTLATEQ